MSDRLSAPAPAPVPGHRPHEIRIGAHLFRWEPPDVGYICYHGDLDGESMFALSEESRHYTLGQPSLFLLVDMAHVGRVSTAARQVSAKGGRDLNLRGIAVIGASGPMRIISSLVSRAVDLLNGNRDNPTCFFETESAARHWIAERRTALTLATRHLVPSPS